MMKHKDEQGFITECRLQIEEKLGWGSSELWHNSVFVELSEHIQEKTHVLLSPTTLKRVWGKVKYDGVPSISTLNTLAQYIGYRNWRDFKNNAAGCPERKKEKKTRARATTVVMSSAFAGIVIISLFSMIKFKKTDPPAIFDFSQVEFSSRPIAEGLPNSVVFDFDLADIDSDSIYIQQYWDPTKTIKIRAGQRQATGIYYYPGYFRSKLLVEGQLVKQHDLYVTSKDWVGTLDYSPVPKYIPAEAFLHGKLSFSQAIMDEISSQASPLGSSYHLVRDFGDISGDNFSLETAVRNVYKDKWAVCQSVRIVILGTKGALIVPFSIPGCVSDLGIMLNDSYLSGKEHDLSAFGADFSEFRDVAIHLRNRQLSVTLDHQQIFEGNYNESIGRFVGIRFRFLGAGEVAYLRVTRADETTVLDTDFNP
ncbi:hypothetical protein [Spongiimicrobium sp. 2-473A-2-J]|uniref:hypothetical protein n=1 Tax=Eudoraea algarum TaxID=3417568 RepID=UPI003D3661D0